MPDADVDYALTGPNLGTTVTWIASPTLINETIVGYGLWTEKCDINVPSSPQRTAYHAAPALAPTRSTVGQRAGHTRDEHEHFRGIAEAVVPQCQPDSDVVGDMVKKDAP